MAQESSSALFSESTSSASNPIAASISLPVALAGYATGDNPFSGFSPNVQSGLVSSFSAGATTAPCGDYVLVTDWQDLASRRARLRLISEPQNQVDLSFVNTSNLTSVPEVSVPEVVPEVEILAHSRIVQNLLDIGLQKLGESQRMSLISSISILKTFPQFACSVDLLDGVSTIFSKWDTALSISKEIIAQQQSFKTILEEKVDIDKEDDTICDQISNETTIYDTEKEDIKLQEEQIKLLKAQIKVLEEQIEMGKSKMMASLHSAETLEAKLQSNRTRSRVLGYQLLNLKDDWTEKLHDVENKQVECLHNWEQLRTLLRLSSLGLVE